MYRRVGKRLFDIVGATLLLIAVAPFLAVAALAVRFALGHPVFWRQLRPGLHGRPFLMTKFRTMTSATRHSGPPAAGRAAPDQAFGRLLRSSSLDELPELLERADGRHEPGRPAAAADAVPRTLHAGAGAPARGQAGHHRPGAGQRPQRDRLGGEVRARRASTSTTARCGSTSRSSR